MAAKKPSRPAKDPATRWGHPPTILGIATLIVTFGASIAGNIFQYESLQKANQKAANDAKTARELIEKKKAWQRRLEDEIADLDMKIQSLDIKQRIDKNIDDGDTSEESALLVELTREKSVLEQMESDFLSKE